MSFRSLARRTSALSLVVTLVACAHATTGSAAHHSRLRQPTTTERLPYEEFGTGNAGRISIEVMVDSTGRADPQSLRITGRTSAEMRPALERWAARARFTPAQQDGHAVAAKYTTELRVETRVVRRG